ncbi:MAG: cyclic nucleotide-binding domain-containing protein [Candidatus Rokubacteria bacterium]|nr:cyclic nucleotide-binding domain-containing protein [Candidatus Rokubacteria bacterium]
MRAAAVPALLGLAWLGSPAPASALSVQEAILRAKPAVALITAEVGAEVTLNCGKGPVTVKPAPFVETGTGWFVDGRGFLVTNAHVVDPPHRLPPWVAYELKKKAIDKACVDPALRAQGVTPGQRPDLEDRIRRDVPEGAMASAKLVPMPQITVLLSNGTKLQAEVKKFSPPLYVDNANRPLPDSGRDLALLRVKEGVYPALEVATREAKIGDPVHILGFPGIVLTHELLDKGVALEASVTNGAVSGINKDAIGQDLVQTDAPAAHGNSGGPAIGDDAALTGVMTFVSLSPVGGAIVQGFNFLIPAKDVRAFLQGTEVSRPGESRFNPVWFAGIQLLLEERYPAAAEKLAEANRVLPNLADVKRALAEAEEKVKNPPPKPFNWAWATLGVSLVSAGAYGGMWTRRWWRNRYRVLPGQVIRYIEDGRSPVLLDVRTKTDFETSPLTLPGAVRLAPEDAEAGRIELEADPGQMIVTYCTSPEEETSAGVAHLLRQRGYRDVRILKGGLGGWTNARLPVEAKSHLPAIGLEIYKNLTLGDIERRHFKAGEVICSEGDDAREEAFVVHAGTVEIRKRIDDTPRVLSRLGEGELFGEMGLFRQAPRSADAVATTDVELLVIKNDRLEWLMRNRPQLTLEIVKHLANLVVSTDKERAQAGIVR